MSWLDFSAFSSIASSLIRRRRVSLNYHDQTSGWQSTATRNEKVDSHHIRFLSRFEFLESLVRIALKKYAKPGKGKGVLHTGCYAAVEHLLTAHIVPYFSTRTLTCSGV